MGATTLVNLDIEKGEALVRSLDGARLDIRGAFWLYLAEASEWRLVLAMPLVDHEGPRAGYEAVQKALARQETALELPLRQISVVGLADPLYRMLRRVVKTAPKAIADIRFTNNVIDNVLVEDAYIYRST